MTMLTHVVEATAIRSFQVSTPDKELTELRRRITATRFPEIETVTDFSQGVPLATTQKLARYWATEYDWRKVEARLNAVPNFITEIDGLDIPHPDERAWVCRDAGCDRRVIVRDT